MKLSLLGFLAPSRSDNKLQQIYLNQYRGAWVRTLTCVAMCALAYGIFRFNIVSLNNILGNVTVVILLCAVNPPFIWLLKISRSIAFTQAVSLLLTCMEIIGYTMVIYFLGGIHSLWLTIMYAVLINYIAFVGPWWRPLAAAVLCSISLFAMVALEHYQIIPHQFPKELIYLGGNFQTAMVAGVIGLLLVMAFTSSYLGVLFRTRRRELEASTRKLEQARNKLRLANDELEKKVETRTAELARINENLNLEVKQRSRTQAALAENEARYRTLFEDNPIQIMVVDEHAAITEYNAATINSAGERPAKGQIMYRDYASAHCLNMLEQLLDCIQNRKPKIFRDLNYFSSVLDIRMSPIRNGAIITMIDQTNKRNLQQQLHRAQKMEAIGVMAGGVAHDLNNILSGIVGYPDLILMDLPEKSPLKKTVTAIQEAGIRAAKVVADLMTIARGIASKKKVLDINSLIIEYLDSIEHGSLASAYPQVHFKSESDPDVLNILGSGTHIKKILMNLAANAAQAIESAGTVTIATANRYLDSPLKGYDNIQIGEYVELTVSDTGMGISRDGLDRIFEPFYTNKILGREGTGLGLSVVWNSVREHDGYIHVQSSHDGTVFTLYFPVTRKPAENEADHIDLSTYMGGNERILVVDDEALQQDIACRFLERMGYRAASVSSGEQAVEYVKTRKVDLIVLDMVMPGGINGRQAYEKITEIHPGQKAIIASGYAMTDEVEKTQQLGAGSYIKKPYTIKVLAKTVQDELRS